MAQTENRRKLEAAAQRAVAASEVARKEYMALFEKRGQLLKERRDAEKELLGDPKPAKKAFLEKTIAELSEELAPIPELLIKAKSRWDSAENEAKTRKDQYDAAPPSLFAALSQSASSMKLENTNEFASHHGPWIHYEFIDVINKCATLVDDEAEAVRTCATELAGIWNSSQSRKFGPIETVSHELFYSAAFSTSLSSLLRRCIVMEGNLEMHVIHQCPTYTPIRESSAQPCHEDIVIGIKQKGAANFICLFPGEIKREGGQEEASAEVLAHAHALSAQDFYPPFPFFVATRAGMTLYGGVRYQAIANTKTTLLYSELLSAGWDSDEIRRVLGGLVVFLQKFTSAQGLTTQQRFQTVPLPINFGEEAATTMLGPKVLVSEHSGAKRVYKVFDTSKYDDGRVPNEQLIRRCWGQAESDVRLETLCAQKGKTVRLLSYTFREGCHNPRSKKQLASICRQLHILHQGDIVHGDIRHCNMVFSDTSDESWIIDFDFAAPEDSRYIGAFNSERIPERHPHARSRALMRKEHDRHALGVVIENTVAGEAVPAILGMLQNQSISLDDIANRIDMMDETALSFHKSGDKTLEKGSPEHIQNVSHTAKKTRIF